MVTKKRPILLSLIALLEMLTGILVMLTGGFFILLSFGLLGGDFDTLLETTFADVFGVLFGVLSGAILFVGFLIFVLGYGLWSLNYAAWFVTIILYGLNFINIMLSYEFYINILQTGNYSYLLTPIVSIGLFLYFLTIRSNFT
ncbi:MAG: hypothetical protein ACW97Z_06615 [Candidatus Hodarchaeales archaeon]|jgi:hypothetical protein